MKRIAIVLVLASAPADAWEPQTTQAGLAEQAALASRLHKRLEDLGFSGGLYEPLTIPPADAPDLMKALKLLSPSEGAVPDARGRQAAIAWLDAGAALADLPSSQAANHFFDTRTGKGWSPPDRSILDTLDDKFREAIGRAALPDKGVPAPDWVVSKQNPFGLDHFLDKYAKAVTASTPGERSRQMAAALIAAGSMLHVLGDMGAPARVRGDSAAQLEPLGGGPDDLGSRFERIAALAYGRLGVPAPSRVVTRGHLRDYFTSKDGTGLADEIANTYFSENTLPAASRVIGNDKPQLARPLPTLPPRLNLMAAGRDDGAIVRNPAGVCLARYKVEHNVLTFSTDDDCMLEQVTAILPEVASYETGLLDFLFRGELAITQAGSNLVVTGKGLGAGTVEVLVEDDRGVRTSIAQSQTAGGAAELTHVAVPQGTRVVALYRGVDASGEPVVAVGALALAAH